MNPGTKNKISNAFIFLYLVLIVLLDQLSKIFILENLIPGKSIPIIKSVFHLTLVLNKGGAFGILSGLTSFFILISLIVIGVILAVLAREVFRNEPIPRNIKTALVCIMAGAGSNLIDRLRFGCVIDFLDFRIWPVFNIADSAITLGTLWLLSLCIRSYSR